MWMGGPKGAGKAQAPQMAQEVGAAQANDSRVARPDSAQQGKHLTRHEHKCKWSA